MKNKNKKKTYYFLEMFCILSSPAAAAMANSTCGCCQGRVGVIVVEHQGESGDGGDG